MWSLLGLIPGLFTTVNGITNAISNERINQINAKTDQERIASQERINSLQAKRDLMIAESGSSKINAIMRASMGASVSLIVAKLLVWDKIVGSFKGCAGPVGQGLDYCSSFRTDIIDANQWSIITAAIGFYFLYEGAVNVTRIAKS
jgi:hypothetical protein